FALVGAAVKALIGSYGLEGHRVAINAIDLVRESKRTNEEAGATEVIGVGLVLYKAHHRASAYAEAELIARRPGGEWAVAQPVEPSGVNDRPAQTDVRVKIVTGVSTQACVAINLAVMNAVIDVEARGREAVAELLLE